MESRDLLKEMIKTRDAHDAAMDLVIEEYISTHTNLLFITDHCMYQWARRVDDLDDDGGAYNEHDQIRAWYSDGLDGVRNSLLTREEQEFIIRKKLHNFHKSGVNFVIENLAVVTVYVSNSKTN